MSTRLRMKIKDLEPFESEWLENEGARLERLRAQSRACPPFRILRAAKAELLSDELQSAVNAHVAACKDCASLQADLDQLPPPDEITPEEEKRILSRVFRKSRPRGIHSFRLWQAVLATAAVVVCAILVTQHMRKPEAPVIVAQQEPLIAEALKLEKPDVKLSLAALTWRGETGTGQEFLSKLRPALDLYKADRFSEAALQFQALSTSYPKSVEIFFYMGVSRLFLGEYAAAAKDLETANGLAGDSFAADSSWYLALAYERSGRAADARAWFESLAAGKNPYADRARAALEALKSRQLSR